VLKQPREHSPLIVGNDTVADARQHHRLAIGGHAFDGEKTGGHQRERNDAWQALVHVGLVDDIADEISAKRGAAGGDGHHGKGERISAPLRRGLLQEQAADQGGPAIGIREQPLPV